MWSVNVLLYYVADSVLFDALIGKQLIVLYFFEDYVNVSWKEYAFALAHWIWFHDVSYFAAFRVASVVPCIVISQISKLSG